ncbi:MAG: diacylglycerol kinase [Planctomycetota bacterium]
MSQFGNSGWKGKFRNALRGVWKGAWGQSSFYVHLPVALIVIASLFYLELGICRASLLLVCIGNVIGAELFNSAIERLAKSIDEDFNPTVGDALDIASGAVLVLALISAIVGVVVLYEPIRQVVFG